MTRRGFLGLFGVPITLVVLPQQALASPSVMDLSEAPVSIPSVWLPPLLPTAELWKHFHKIRPQLELMDWSELCAEQEALFQRWATAVRKKQ